MELGPEGQAGSKCDVVLPSSWNVWDQSHLSVQLDLDCPGEGAPELRMDTWWDMGLQKLSGLTLTSHALNLPLLPVPSKSSYRASP